MKEQLLKLAEDINKLVNQNKTYNANIITELHANENAHSRILRMFLQYDDGTKEYPILRKFLDIPKVKDVILNVQFHQRLTPLNLQLMQNLLAYLHSSPLQGCFVS